MNSRSTDSAELAVAVRAVVSDPDILAGVPVLKGTRMPVYMVSHMCKSGISLGDILLNYPSLTPRLVELAQLYAEENPGTPVAKAPLWRAGEPMNSVTVPYSTSRK
jgi:uncharacterized protein (DUF433 family)